MELTKQQIIDLLVDWQQSLTPWSFPESKDLETEDFMDTVMCHAQELGLEQEFEEALKLKGFEEDPISEDEF